MAACRQMGLSSIGVELTHLGVAIAKTRLQPPDVEMAEHLAKRWAKLAPSNNYDTLSDELVEWIGEENAGRLQKYLDRLESISDNSMRAWLEVAISSALRPSSKWLPGSIKPQVEPSRTPPSLAQNFVRSAHALARDCVLENISSPSVLAEVIRGDAQRLSFANETFDAIITSPPYGTMYDYFDVHRLSYLAFEWPCNLELQIGKSSRISMDGVGFVPPNAVKSWYHGEYDAEATLEGRTLRAYIQSMSNHFSEVFRVLRSGGVVVYAVADSVRSGRRFPLARAISQLLSEAGFSDVETRPRKNSSRRILPAGRDLNTGRFSSNARTAVTEKMIWAVKK